MGECVWWEKVLCNCRRTGYHVDTSVLEYGRRVGCEEFGCQSIGENDEESTSEQDDLQIEGLAVARASQDTVIL